MLACSSACRCSISWAMPITLGDIADQEVSDGLLEAVEAEVFPSGPVVIVHTSGTTSDLKGVVHSHGVVVRQSVTLAPGVRAM